MISIMNLPNEMVFGVFQNLDQESIDRVSKVNRRFQAIVQRYKLYKPLAKEIKITRTTTYSGNKKTIQLLFNAVLLKNNKNYEGSTYNRKYSMKYNSSDSNESVENKMVDLLKVMSGSVVSKIDLPVAGLGVPFDVLRKACARAFIDLSNLIQVESCQSLQLPEVDDEHLMRLMKTKPEKIRLNNCKTSVTFPEMFSHIELAVHNNIPVNWNFGSIAEDNIVSFAEHMHMLNIDYELIPMDAGVLITKIKRTVPSADGKEKQFQEFQFNIKITL